MLIRLSSYNSNSSVSISLAGFFFYDAISTGTVSLAVTYDSLLMGYV